VAFTSMMAASVGSEERLGDQPAGVDLAQSSAVTAEGGLQSADVEDERVGSEGLKARGAVVGEVSGLKLAMHGEQRVEGDSERGVKQGESGQLRSLAEGVRPFPGSARPFRRAPPKWDRR
jgi:hypothetical protein